MRKTGLADLSNHRYRIVLEESWYHEQPEIRKPDRRWYEQIPCKGGAFISLYAETPTIILQLYTPRVKNARFIFGHLKDFPGVKRISIWMARRRSTSRQNSWTGWRKWQRPGLKGSSPPRRKLRLPKGVGPPWKDTEKLTNRA